MQYPLYDFYNASDLTLEEILKHYIKNFYLRKHGSNKVEKVLNKISGSSKIKNLFEQSASQRIAPNYVDFGSVINEMFYFFFQSNSTQALAVLAAAIAWNKQVNFDARLKSEKAVRDDAIKIFKKYSIYEDMSRHEYDEMTNPPITQSRTLKDFKEHIPAEDLHFWENPEFQTKLINIYAECDNEEQVREQVSILLERFRREEKNKAKDRFSPEALAAHLNLSQEDIDKIKKKEEELNLAPDLSNNDNLENKLFDLAKSCVSRLSREFKHLSSIGEAEALLFFSTLIVDLGVIKNNIDLDIMEDKYKLLLCDEILGAFDADDFFDFVNKRVNFYTTQYERVKCEKLFTPMFIYNAFYLNPGCENPGYLSDFKESPIILFELQSKLFELEAFIDKAKKQFV